MWLEPKHWARKERREKKSLKVNEQLAGLAARLRVLIKNKNLGDHICETIPNHTPLQRAINWTHPAPILLCCSSSEGNSGNSSILRFSFYKYWYSYFSFVVQNMKIENSWISFSFKLLTFLFPCALAFLWKWRNVSKPICNTKKNMPSQHDHIKDA